MSRAAAELSGICKEKIVNFAWNMESWILYLDNAPARFTFSSKAAFLCEKQTISKLGNQPFSPDVVLCYFYLF